MPNYTTTTTAGSAVLSITSETLRDYYLMRWHANLLELRWLAKQLGFEDRLPKREEWRGQGD